MTSNVDDFGVARAQAAQFMAYGAGIAWIVEPLLALMIRRPEATPAGIPAGDPRIGPGSTGLVALKSRQKRVTSAEFLVVESWFEEVRTGLFPGGSRIRTCMGLFLSSGCFGFC